MHDEKQGYDVSNPALQPTHKRVLHTQAVRSWFVRSSDKDGQSLLLRPPCGRLPDYPVVDGRRNNLTERRNKQGQGIPLLGSPDEDHRLAKFEARERPNLMDAVNGNATENLYCIARCCSGIANIHEETF